MPDTPDLKRRIVSPAKVVEFYKNCVEAEAAGLVRVTPGASGHVELTAGTSPVHGRSKLPTKKSVESWCDKRNPEQAPGEVILAGWPMVIGSDRDSGTNERVATPLLTTEVQLSKRDERWVSTPAFSFVELNPYALDLLVGSREERDSLLRVVERRTPAVEEAKTLPEQATAILSVLSANGVEGIDSLDPRDLTNYDRSNGVHNAGLLMTSSGSTRFTAMLIKDLEGMSNSTEMLRSGSVAVMLGQAPATSASALKPHPTLLPSTLAQDQAVMSAMRNRFTVVTGPPGTGKSQVLVNAIAAAVAAGQSVLFASKNNQAVDVVFQRMSYLGGQPCIVRTGASSLRGEVAERISKIVAASPGGHEIGPAQEAWAAAESKIRLIHRQSSEREELLVQRRSEERRLSSLQEEHGALIEEAEHQQASLVDRPEPDTATPDTVEPTPDPADETNARIARVVGDLRAGINPAELDDSVAKVQTALKEIGRSGWLIRRKKVRRQAAAAQKELSRLHQDATESSVRTADILGELAEVGECGDAEASGPDPEPAESTPTPHDHLESTRERIEAKDREIEACRQIIIGIGDQLCALPTRQDADDVLHRLASERIEAGRDLLDARWDQIRRDETQAMKAAGELAEHLRESTTTGARPHLSRTHELTKRALPAIPVWGVTNLSARTNLPLSSGLFDLVVIDEASQCDAASALPLLARAKRALIIGDRRQLNHITALSRARETVIGERVGLSEDQIDEFSYRGRSCFGLAASRLNEAPIFLDLHFRSHPSIIGFANEKFYDGKLELCSDSRPPSGSKAISWMSVEGSCVRGPNRQSYANRAEAERLVQEVAAVHRDADGLGLTIGVVTPFRAQAEHIRDLLRESLGNAAAEGITVGTVHRFQGDERDLMFFSPVVAAASATTGKPRDFAANPDLVNVAITRARRRLVVVGDMTACLDGKDVLSDLARYVQRLETGQFDSPVEQMLHEALLARGIPSAPGESVAGHRLDLAVVNGHNRLDVECDGAAFHTNRDQDAERDRAIEAEGWQVLRFSGRKICNDIDACVAEVAATLKESEMPLDEPSVVSEHADGAIQWPSMPTASTRL